MEIESLAFSPDGRRIGSGSEHSVKIWNIGNGQTERVLECRHSRVDSLVFSPQHDTWEPLPFYTINNEGWVTYSEERILTLPFDFDLFSGYIAVRQNVLAFTCRKGWLIILKLNGAPDV